MTAPRFGSGGSPLGAGLSGGLDAFWNVFQMLSEKKRQDALDAEARKQRNFQNTRLTAGDTRAQHAQDIGDITTAAELGRQGAVVDEPTSASRSPGMTALRAPRPMTAADLQTPGRIRIDPTQSMAALLEAKRSGALSRYADSPTPQNRAAALGAGVPPADIEQFTPKPTQPKTPTIRNFGGLAGKTDEQGNFTGYVTGPDGKPLHEGNPPPEESWTLQKDLTDPATRQPRLAWVNPKTRERVWADELGAKGAAGQGGERAGLAAAFLSRLKMGKNDFENALNFVRDFHSRAMADPDLVTPTMMAKAAAASTQPNPDAHGFGGLVGNAITGFGSGQANKSLAEGSPDYQRYVNLMRAMSLAMTEVLPRPTQQLLGIESGLNTVKAGDTPERIADMQHRLEGAYQFLFADPEGMLRKGTPPTAPPVAGAGGRTGQPPQAAAKTLSPQDAAKARTDPNFAAWLKSQGYIVPPNE